ncbi:MAG: RrF2 family transcriptional regulator [Planctomycetota bacterium]
MAAPPTDRKGAPLKLSTKARYGLRATAELALRKVVENGGTRPVPLSSIAKRQGIPEQYLRQIFMPLKRAGIVKAVRGKNGGYLLGRKPEKISALDVVRAMGELLEPVFCVGTPSKCRRVGECPTHPLWCKLADAMRQALSTTSVAQLAEMCPKRGRLALPQGHTFNI